MHSSLFTCSAWKIGVCEFRGSATGFLIAVEPKTRKALPVPRIAAVNHRLYMPVTSNCAPPRHVNCWQHSSEQPARIIHIFTGSQINSPRSNPEARILKLWQPETSIFIFSCPKQLFRFRNSDQKEHPSPTHRWNLVTFISALFCPLNPIYSSLLLISPGKKRLWSIIELLPESLIKFCKLNKVKYIYRCWYVWFYKYLD